LIGSESICLKSARKTQHFILQTWVIRTRLAAMLQFHLGSKLARFAVTPVLVLWMAGTGCILGCGSGQAAESRHSAYRSAGIDSPSECSAGVTHDCCAGKKRARDSYFGLNHAPPQDVLAITDQPTDGLRRCPMGLNSSTVASQIRTPEMVATPAQPLFQSSGLGEQLIRLSHQLPILNRGGTHLRCCVFLI
jgi:hypothetical protein